MELPSPLKISQKSATQHFNNHKQRRPRLQINVSPKYAKSNNLEQFCKPQVKPTISHKSILVDSFDSDSDEEERECMDVEPETCLQGNYKTVEPRVQMRKRTFTQTNLMSEEDNESCGSKRVRRNSRLMMLPLQR